MRTPTILLVVGILILSPPGCSKAPRARLATVHGKVLVDGQTARAGLPLPENSQVRVFAGGFARIAFQDGSTQVLFPLPDRKEPLTYSIDSCEEPGQAQTMACNFAHGVMRFLLPKKRRGPMHFRIQTEHTVTCIRGTQGEIQTSPDGDRVSLVSGTVDVTQTASGETVVLNAGDRVETDPDGGFVLERQWNAIGREDQEETPAAVDAMTAGAVSDGATSDTEAAAGTVPAAASSKALGAPTGKSIGAVTPVAPDAGPGTVAPPSPRAIPRLPEEGRELPGPGGEGLDRPFKREEE